MLILFTLSMPGNNAWDGRWSGEGRLYCRVKSIRSQKVVDRLMEKTSYGYNFGDGWFARVDVSIVDAAEARKLRKNSQGFCGYDWMIDSIMAHGQITTERTAHAV